MNSCHY